METVLGPPIVSVVAGSELINITINPPVSHLKSADGKCTISMLNETVYPLLIYTIKLVQSNLSPLPIRNEKEVVKDENATFTIRNLLPVTNYCISVEVSASANMNPRNIPSPIECVTTKHQPRTEDGNKFAIIISVASVFVVLFITLLLIGLDFTGYLCIKKNTPDILMWLPRSEGTHNRNTELNDPKYVIPADLLSEVGNIECRIYHDNGRQNSDASISFLENGERNASGLCNNAPRPSTSSPAKPSGQECGPSAEEAMPTEHVPLLEIPKSHCQKTLFPVKALYITSNCSQDKNEVCNVNFKSVSLGDPELIWSSLKQELPPQMSQNTITGLHNSRSPVVQKFRLFVNILNLDVPPLEQSKDYSSKEKMTSGYSDFSDPEEDLTSDYIK
ncbi:interferon alpha beta receptor 2-like [Pelobates cultripes]|nr:interferon alpha beta receptor 2-like [Pelobates cultripes]